MSIERKPPPGMVWKCPYCGRKNHDVLDWTNGWDESCALNAVAVFDDGDQRNHNQERT